MAKPNSLLIYPWTLWCWFVLCLGLLIFFPPLLIAVWIGTPSAIRFAIAVPRTTTHFVNFFMGIRLKRMGQTIPDFTQKYIFISNHNSNLDPFITGALIKSPYKFIGKSEVLKIPVFGFVLRKLYVSVKREDAEDRAKSMAGLAKALSEGYSLVMYPEGTRNRGKEIAGPFNEGAFRLSIEYGVPIIMICAINSAERIPPTRWILSPGPLYYEWSEPLTANPGEDKHAFSMRIRELMIEKIRTRRKELKIE